MPVGVHQRDDPETRRGVLEFLRARRADLPAGRGEEVQLSYHKRGYLSTMYRVRVGAASYLAAVKHHDGSAARARREWDALEARRGRFAPLPVAADTSGRFLDDAIVLTEYVPERRWRRGPDSLAELARIIADIHTDARLAELPVDEGAPRVYSLEREFDEEASVIPTFRAGPFREQLEEMRELLRPRVERWAGRFAPGEVVYCHGDLPHHHVYSTARGPVVIHWEFSRLSHPSREFGRICCLGEFSAVELETLLGHYHALVPHRVSMRAVSVQEILEHFYGCIHTVFWMDRGGYDVAEKHLQTALARVRLTNAFVRALVEREEASEAAADGRAI